MRVVFPDPFGPRRATISRVERNRKAVNGHIFSVVPGDNRLERAHDARMLLITFKNLKQVFALNHFYHFIEGKIKGILCLQQTI